MSENRFSCVRTKVDQNKIDRYYDLVKQHKSGFKDIAKQINLAGNEVRLKILWLLEQSEFCVCDLSDILQMSIPAISQHLRKLKDNNMVDFRRDGQTLFYFIHPELSHYVRLIIKELSIETKELIND
jgi:DNA-binding transcriptional ArsR family regulator